MPKRIPVQTVVVHRDGKRVVPTIGVPFNFTDDELKQIVSANPRAVRKIIIEDPEAAAAAKVNEENGGAKTDLSAMTVAQLKELAAEKEIDLGDATKKDDIIAKIEAGQGAEDL